jgi:hypothetical protein
MNKIKIKKKKKKMVRWRSLLLFRVLLDFLLFFFMCFLQCSSVIFTLKTIFHQKKEKTLHKNRAGEVIQDEGPEFKPQYCKKKQKKQL